MAKIDILVSAWSFSPPHSVLRPQLWTEYNDRVTVIRRIERKAIVSTGHYSLPLSRKLRGVLPTIRIPSSSGQRDDGL